MTDDLLILWAIKYGVPPAALVELRMALIGPDFSPAKVEGRLETAVQSEARLFASRIGGRLFRNNIGAGKMENGSFVRFGLANDSAAVNDKIKSGDLIGVYPITITPAHIGSVIGQFWSIECKKENWSYKGTDREVAQLKWAEIITGLGGRARIINKADQI